MGTREKPSPTDVTTVSWYGGPIDKDYMSKSIDAYDDEERVRRYDRDMDLLHPNRHKMVEIALEVLPHGTNDPILALDLGIGTGYFTSKLLTRFPQAAVVGIDGSGAMIHLAESRLRQSRGRVRLVTASFEELDGDHIGKDSFDVVLSSYALHHLDAASKRNVLGAAIGRLKTGGWLLNADLVSNPHQDIEGNIQDIRARGIQTRNAGADPRFADMERIREFLDALEENEGDQPLTVDEDLQLLRECGITNATVFWQEYRELVMGGCKNAG